MFSLQARVLFDKKRASMEDSLEGIADETETPTWALHLIKKRRRAGFENVFIYLVNVDALY